MLGKHSGRAALADRARQLGYDVQGEPLKELFVAFKKLADEKKEIYDDDIVTLIEQQIHGTTEDESRVKNYEFRLNSDGRNLVALTLAKGGESKMREYSHSEGPFSAAFAAVQEITGLEMQCKSFEFQNASLGDGAYVTVEMEVEHEGEVFRARGTAHSSIDAALMAFAGAANRIEIRKKAAADGLTI